MCDRHEYEHLMPSDLGDNKYEAEYDESMDDRGTSPQSNFGVKDSPWVRRNNAYAQFPQPRGSQYEGSDW